jgi:hypothetical protein
MAPRGSSPEDDTLFSAAGLARLGLAYEEAAWLLGRGYPSTMAIRTVGDHHQLHARQRLALQRATCSEAARRARTARRVPVDDLAGLDLAVDAFNLIITLEIALEGGLVIAGADGALRDLAGMRGSYRLVDATATAIELVGDALRAMGAASASFWLDAPVSSSGALRATILDRAARFPCPISAELVPDADRALAGRSRVVSSDAAVLDACESWVGLARWIVAERIPNARVVDFVGAVR